MIATLKFIALSQFFPERSTMVSMVCNKCGAYALPVTMVCSSGWIEVKLVSTGSDWSL